MFCCSFYCCRVKVVSGMVNWISIGSWFSSILNPWPCLMVDRFFVSILQFYWLICFVLWLRRCDRWFVHWTVACMCGVFRLCSSCWREGFLLPSRSLGAGSSILFLSLLLLLPILSLSFSILLMFCVDCTAKMVTFQGCLVTYYFCFYYYFS